ncbi:hypothetical protein CEE37_09210 [candidate division LCP-89 bacterium B3_LCP]|uniref:VanZ-like domain-containing protein n=1 Tax=candidate division LCP-89 bacterium B3_LCP TaxID=2012998 RepID=A0A532UZV3_UNCL8|nr:MAG: hypothetical protein CEE37_09210 [candidate division LCP-89 bacterium B3_LCP]
MTVYNKDLKESSPLAIILSWAALIGWVGFIYATLGTVPTWREFLQDRYGEGIFGTITYFAAGICLVAILFYMLFGRKERKFFPYIVLVLVMLFLRYTMRHWITIPVEQIHFIEYGMVGFLAFNALRYHLSGWALITAALFIAYFFGMIDECIQGLLENRVGEQRDMYWNGLAAALVLVIVAFSIKPKVIFHKCGFREARIHLLIVALCLPIQGYFNSTFAQFGYLIEDDALAVVFRSRLDVERLKLYDDNLDHFKQDIAPRIGKERMNTLLGDMHDKIHEEVTVHSFRRFYHGIRGNYPVAYKESLILSHYFPQFISGTSLDWPRGKIKELQDKIGNLVNSTYYSPVAEHLITKFTQLQMWFVIIMLEIFILILIARSFRKNQ